MLWSYPLHPPFTSSPTLDAAQLEEVLEALRRSRGETSYIEVKAAATDLPDNVHETLSAFANTGGGSILLGVSEDRGGFRVSGVEDPTRVANQLRDLCSHMVPVLRPRVDRIAHADGVVLAIEVTPIDRRQRPCFLESAGAFGGSFVRMDEGDVQLLDGEVAALLAERSTEDASRNPAPDGTTLDPDAVSAFVASVRASSPRWQTVPEDELLRSRQVVTDGQPTIAGSMALSFDPDRTIPAARIAYRVEPGAGAPAGTRFSGDSISGPIGVLMDEVLEHLRNDLGRLVSTEQGTEDVYEVPIRGLREIISNALVHRSYTEGQFEQGGSSPPDGEGRERREPGRLLRRRRDARALRAGKRPEQRIGEHLPAHHHAERPAHLRSPGDGRPFRRPGVARGRRCAAPVHRPAS